MNCYEINVFKRSTYKLWEVLCFNRCVFISNIQFERTTAITLTSPFWVHVFITKVCLCFKIYRQTAQSDQHLYNALQDYKTGECIIGIILYRLYSLCMSFMHLNDKILTNYIDELHEQKWENNWNCEFLWIKQDNILERSLFYTLRISLNCQ